MNELEKKFSLEENSIPETTANAEVVTENVTAEFDNQSETDEEVAQGTRRYFEMEKADLLALLQEIVDSEGVNQHKEVNAIKQAYFAKRKAEIEEECRVFLENAAEGDVFSSTPDPDEARFKELLTVFKDKRTNYLAAEEQRRQDNLAKKLAIIEQLKALVEDIDNINLHFQQFQQLQQDFKAITDIPASAVSDTWKNYQLVVEQFYDRLKMNKELRDLDFKKNLEAKRVLVDEAKALAAEEDVVEAFKKLQALHDQWREIGPVAKELREDIWNEFKDASTVINKRHQDFFEARKEAEKANEDAKVALCEEIEAIAVDELKSFAAWDEATKKIIDAQERWKAVGYASKKVNNTLFARFRKACDDFFASKAEYYKSTKEAYASNLEKKTALCERAEALRECEDFNKAAEEIKELQAKWKKIGTVPRRQSDEIWQRFQTACNYFYEEKKKQYAVQRQEETANLAAKREVVAAIKALTADTDRKEAVKVVREMQAKWQTIGHVPFKQKDKLYAEYREALKVAYDMFDVKETRARMANFENQLNELKGDGNKLYRERERLMRALEQKRNELKTYENNMGFFSFSSKSGNSMLKDLERKTQKIKDDMAMIEQKINLLDSKMD
jgi:hypothetical protein